MVIFRCICMVIQYKPRSSGIRTFCPKIFINMFCSVVNHDNMQNLLNKDVIRNMVLKIGTKKVVEMCC